MLGAAFFVGTFGFIVLATSPGANAFTFTTIDVPGAMSTSADRISARGLSWTAKHTTSRNCHARYAPFLC
jgi:hypothetical protein